LKTQEIVTEIYSKRNEMEENWSMESLNQLLSRLSHHLGVNMDDGAMLKYNDNPKISLLYLDFEIIQKRETNGIVISAVDKRAKGIVLEFVIGSTT
jgi:hypothetical protein